MNFEQWLTANGYDSAKLSEPQKKHLTAAWKDETQPPIPATIPVAKPAIVPESSAKDDSSYEQEVEAARKEAARQNTIKDMTKRAIQAHNSNRDKIDKFDSLCQEAIADRWNLQKFELAMLREERSIGPMVITPRAMEVTDDVLEAAVCQMGRLNSLEKSFSERTLEAAHKQFRGGIGLHELLGFCARNNGWRGVDVKRDMRTAMRSAFGYGNVHDMRADVAASTLSVSGILSNTANKFLRDSWNAVENEWRKISAIRAVNDFKAITTYSLTGDLGYEKIAPGGELKHGKLGNETYTNQADSYGKIIGIDRRDLINDDLGAFTQVGKRLGRGGALKLNEVFWAEFLADHSTFFPTDASLLNYDAGTDTAFGADGLTAADVFWKAKTDPDGKPLGLMAKFILVPPASRIPALRLMNSQQVFKDTDLGGSNPWTGMFEVVSSVYLANSAMGGGYSSLAWYLIADPNELPVIETCFLNGAESPTVETVEMAADHLGLAMRAYHDFGVNKQEYRAAMKLKGEA